MLDAEIDFDLHIFCLFSAALCAKYKLDETRFDEFVQKCLRKTLAQLICDVRRKYKTTLVQQQSPQLGHANQNQQHRYTSASTITYGISHGQSSTSD